VAAVFAAPNNRSAQSLPKTLSTKPGLVMPGLVPGIHVLKGERRRKTWMAGTWASEATPFFERLCPAMTRSDSLSKS
jgi:hypothetical protein